MSDDRAATEAFNLALRGLGPLDMADWTVIGAIGDQFPADYVARVAHLLDLAREAGREEGRREAERHEDAVEAARTVREARPPRPDGGYVSAAWVLTVMVGLVLGAASGTALLAHVWAVAVPAMAGTVLVWWQFERVIGLLRGAR